MTNKTGPFFQLYDKNIQLQKSITSFLLEAATAGAPLHDLLHGTQIFANDLTQPEGRCHHRDWLTLLERCQPFISPTLPFAAADNLLHNPDHSLCQSLLRAPDLARSLRQLFYFRHQLMPSIFVLVRKSHTRISIIVKAALPLHAQQPLVLHLVMAFLIQLIQLTTGQAAALSLQLKAPPQGSECCSMAVQDAVFTTTGCVTYTTALMATAVSAAGCYRISRFDTRLLSVKSKPAKTTRDLGADTTTTSQSPAWHPDATTSRGKTWVKPQ